MGRVLDIFLKEVLSGYQISYSPIVNENSIEPLLLGTTKGGAL
jgi:hypothetical protein